jgi:type IV pilus assembly protein PilW
MSAMSSPERVRRMRGLALIEIMVGITLGLMVLAAALATAAMTLLATSAADDSADLQQRADLALQLIGKQVREAGAVQLVSRGRFAAFGNRYDGWAGDGMAVSGLEGGPGKPDTLRLSHAFAGGERDCLGNAPLPPGPPGTYPPPGRIDNSYLIAPEAVNDNRPALYCLGNGALAKQALMSNVDDLQLRFGVRDTSGALQYLAADAVPAASVVVGVSVCLQLSGAAGQSAPGGALDCDGKPISPGKATGRFTRLARAVFMVRNAPA